MIICSTPFGNMEFFSLSMAYDFFYKLRIWNVSFDCVLLSFLLKVVTSVVRYGDPKLVHPLSLAAAHCMGEVTLSSETRESSHNYPNDTVDEVKSVRRH